MHGSNPSTGQTPLLAIVGPTASGKSSLAIQLAQNFNGELICADSRTIYKGMNIGTAKPSLQDQEAIPHHLLDVVEPDQAFSAAEFQQQAQAAISDIQLSGALPILVGGTGLYIDSILYNYSFKEGRAAQPDSELANLAVEQLQARAEELGIALNHSDWHNPRRLIRAIETHGQPATKNELRPNTLIIGLSVDPAELEARIITRVHQMVDAGFQQEVEELLKHHKPDSEAMTGIGYRSFAAVATGQLTQQQAIDQTIQDTKRYAKRQMTWFKRDKNINWVHNSTEVQALVAEFLA